MALNEFPIETSPLSSDMQSFIQSPNDAAARTALGVPAGSGTSTGSNTGDQTITLTGDVTGSGTGSFATAIAAGVVGPTELANTAVTPGSYTAADITVDAQGRITAAANGGGSSGDVVGPASATDEALARFNLTTGKLIQNSVVTVSDTGAMAGVTDLSTTGIRTSAGASVDTAVAVAASGAVNIDFTKPLTTQALTGDSTWTATGSPTTNQKTFVRVSADGTPRTITLFANVTPIGQTGALANFVVPANTSWEIYLEHVGSSNYLIANQPPLTTGTGAYVLANSPALVTPDLGTPTAVNLGSASNLPASAISAGTLAANITLGEDNGQLILDPALSADGKWSGIMEAGTAGATLAFGDLCYFSVTDSRWELADADADSTSGAVKLGMCVLAAAGDGSATNMLLWGKIRADSVFPTFTVGAPVYVGTTAGDVQVAQPSGTDDVIRIVGYGNTADELFFQPSNDFMTHV